MAKRKRLAPARPTFLDSAESAAPSAPAAALSAGDRAPIAQVAAEASAQAALEEVSRNMAAAREEGRLIQAIPLHEIVVDHLVRDRVEIADEAMIALKQSLVSRGQQTPIEVAELPDGAEGEVRYGLLSGWRRVQALKELSAEHGSANYGTVLALLRQPADQAAAYVAMVEENEIRADLSFFERARIVEQSLAAGVFDSEKEALQSLFSSASYARRSKIKSFLPVVRGLDGAVQFPSAISERFGLQLSKALLADAGLAGRLRQALLKASAQTAEAEIGLLLAGMKDGTARAQAPAARDPLPPSETVSVSAEKDKIVLSGPGVDAELVKALKSWLKARQS